MTDDTGRRVVVVGGGVAGLSAATFTARAGVETLVLDAGGSILRHNTHPENSPGFPAGVNGRLLLEMAADGAERAGADRREAAVTALDRRDDGFAVHTAAGDSHRADYVIAATKNEVGYLEGLEGIDEAERRRREARSRATMREYFAEPHPDPQETHPGLTE
jgi:thioredoxin reductase